MPNPPQICLKCEPGAETKKAYWINKHMNATATVIFLPQICVALSVSGSSPSWNLRPFPSEDYINPFVTWLNCWHRDTLTPAQPASGCGHLVVAPEKCTRSCQGPSLVAGVHSCMAGCLICTRTIHMTLVYVIVTHRTSVQVLKYLILNVIKG